MSQLGAQMQLSLPLVLSILNQLCDLEQKLLLLPDAASAHRNVSRMKDAFSEMNFTYEYPMGQPFKETRTDVEAHIAGKSTENLRIVEVMKPIIRYTVAGTSRIIQPGIVVVKSDQE